MTNFIDFPLNSSDVIQIIQTLYSITHYIDNGEFAGRDDILYFHKGTSLKKAVYLGHTSPSEAGRWESNTFPLLPRAELHGERSSSTLPWLLIRGHDITSFSQKQEELTC